jgi:hypothetical protein
MHSVQTARDLGRDVASALRSDRTRINDIGQRLSD